MIMILKLFFIGGVEIEIEIVIVIGIEMIMIGEEEVEEEEGRWNEYSEGEMRKRKKIMRNYVS